MHCVIHSIVQVVNPLLTTKDKEKKTKETKGKISKCQRKTKQNEKEKKQKSKKTNAYMLCMLGKVTKGNSGYYIANSWQTKQKEVGRLESHVQYTIHQQ